MQPRPRLTARRLGGALLLTSLLAPAVNRVAATSASAECIDVDADTIRGLEEQRFQALVDADLDAMDSLFADDYELIDPSGDLSTREQYFSEVRLGGLDYLEFVPVGEIAVRIDCRSASARYESRIDITIAGVMTREDDLLWHTDLWEYRDGSWQIVWAQATIQE